MKPITENIIEQSAIELLQQQGWDYVHGKEISPEGLYGERSNFVMLFYCNVYEMPLQKLIPTYPNMQEKLPFKIYYASIPLNYCTITKSFIACY